MFVSDVNVNTLLSQLSFSRSVIMKNYFFDVENAKKLFSICKLQIWQRNEKFFI